MVPALRIPKIVEGFSVVTIIGTNSVLLWPDLDHLSSCFHWVGHDSSDHCRDESREHQRDLSWVVACSVHNREFILQPVIGIEQDKCGVDMMNKKRP